MKKVLFLLLIIFVALNSNAQSDTKIYDPSANAENDINALVKLAKIEHKNILLQQVVTGAVGVLSLTGLLTQIVQLILY